MINKLNDALYFMPGPSPAETSGHTPDGTLASKESPGPDSSVVKSGMSALPRLNLRAAPCQSSAAPCQDQDQLVYPATRLLRPTSARLLWQMSAPAARAVLSLPGFQPASGWR